MRVLPFESSDDQIRTLVIEWNELLAAREYAEALDLLHPCVWDPQTCESWSPEILSKHISFRGGIVPVDERRFEVTSYSEAKLPDWMREHEIEVDRHELREDGDIGDRYPAGRPSVGIVHYDLTLNGFFTDLTARFNVRPVSGGIALELMDIHTL